MNDIDLQREAAQGEPLYRIVYGGGSVGVYRRTWTATLRAIRYDLDNPVSWRGRPVRVERRYIHTKESELST